jgi:phospholipase/carboxylesterase
MNRIQNLVDDEVDLSLTLSGAALPAAALDPLSEEPHCIFTPKHYERNYAYPLIVWLHSADDDERQVARVLPLVSDRNYVAVGPRGTAAGQGDGAYTWSQAAEHILLAGERVHRAIAATRRWLNVAPGRIYLAGYGCGGTMALRLALAEPEQFAGVLSVDGPLPSTLRPLCQFRQTRGVNVFLASGRHSRLYPEADVCRDLRLLHASGVSVCLRQYPGGDEVTDHMLLDMDRWIMEQIAACQPAAQDQASSSSRRK